MSGRLMADLHVHTKEDVIDHQVVKYTADDLAVMARRLGFDVLAVTNHRVPTLTKDAISRAADRGMTLLPGVEAELNGKHVLVISPEPPVPVPKNFADLGAIKNDGCLVIAPHPFFPGPASLFSDFERHIEAFNAVECCHFYTSWSNRNRKAIKLAKKYHLPLVGTSDMHFLPQLGYTFTLIDAPRDPAAIIAAVLQNRIELVTKPVPSLPYIAYGTAKMLKTVLVDLPQLYLLRRR